MSSKEDYERGCVTLIEQKGNPVGMHSDACMDWHKTHETCDQCPSELGCSQLVGLLLVSMDADPMGKVDQIINAKSAKDIQSVPFQFIDYGEDYPDNYPD